MRIARVRNWSLFVCFYLYRVSCIGSKFWANLRKIVPSEAVLKLAIIVWIVKHKKGGFEASFYHIK